MGVDHQTWESNQPQWEDIKESRPGAMYWTRNGNANGDVIHDLYYPMKTWEFAYTHS